jgi:hypothetical protein
MNAERDPRETLEKTAASSTRGSIVVMPTHTNPPQD